MSKPYYSHPNRSVSFNTSFYENLNFDLIRDIAPVAGIVGFPMVITVRAPFPGGDGFYHCRNARSGRDFGAKSQSHFQLAGPNS